MIHDPSRSVHHSSRSAPIARQNLRGSAAELGFDRLARLATGLLSAWGALIWLREGERHFLKTCTGPPEEWSSWKEASASSALFEHPAASGAPLAVEDARQDPLLRQDALVRELRVAGFLGIPLSTSDGRRVGAFCVVDTAPRTWTESAITLLEEIAASAMLEIEARVDAAERGRTETALELYREIFAHSTEAIAIIDRDGYYLEQNATHRELIGYSDEELKGQTPAIHFGQQAFLSIARDLAQHGRFQGELTSRTKDGRLLDIELSAFAVRDPAGQPACYVGIKRDVTERNRAHRQRMDLLAREQAARAMAEAIQQRYRNLVDSVEAIVWEADAESWRFTFVSQRAESILGYPVQRWLSEPDFWVNLIHPDDRRDAVEHCRHCIRNGADHEFEYRAIAADGRIVWLRDIVRVVKDDQGQVRQLRGLMVDVTERKQTDDGLHFLADASTALASSLDFQTTLQSVAGLAVPALADWCIVDVVEDDGRISRLAVETADPARAELAEEVRRFAPDPESPRAPMQVLRSGQPELIAEVTEEWLRSHARDAEHLELLRRIRPRSLLLVPLLARDRTLGILWFVMAESGRHYGASDLALAQDLGQRCALAMDNARLYKEAQDAIHLRDEFLSIAAHELKTPITSLRGFAQLLARRLAQPGSVEPERLNRALATIDAQSDRLNQLIEQILDISRLDAGKLVLERQRTDLVPLVTSTVAAAQERSSKHALELRAPERLLALADPLRLEQVLTNLLDNAIRYSPYGGWIGVELRRVSEQWVELAVQDHGVGVPAEHRARLFDRFYQGHQAKQFGGMGLGLYISRQIVELHGGSISLDSQEGAGTTVTVRLPVA